MKTVSTLVKICGAKTWSRLTVTYGRASFTLWIDDSEIVSFHSLPLSIRLRSWLAAKSASRRDRRRAGA